MAIEELKLCNQFCFPIYAASRLIIREYQPYLDKLGITYPQYLVMMVLWETDGVSVNDITQKLILNTNTVTPLLKRLEANGLLTRTRAASDERKVIIQLTEKGKNMQQKAALVPQEMAKSLKAGSTTLDDMIELRNKLNLLIDSLSQKEQP